jgi:nitroreductase
MDHAVADTLLDSLHWRYATKAFDPQRTIPAGVWDQLEQALVLTPTSFGLQPYRFVVVTDPDLKLRLRAASWGQAQVGDCSHLVVFMAQDALTEANVDEHLANIAQVRAVTVDSLAFYRSKIVGHLLEGPRPAVAAQWETYQTYIALGNLLTSAALLGVDSCALGGIEPGRYDEILGISGFHTVCACALGFRSGNDKYASAAKVRFPRERLVIHR